MFRFFLSVLLIVCNSTFALEVKLIERIPLSQRETALLYVSPFAVTEDEVLILPDIRSGDIKLYDKKGELITVWGRRGPGPDEFNAPVFCDYQKPYFVIMDFGKRNLSLFERAGKDNFQSIQSFHCTSLGSDIKLMNDILLISGYVVNNKGEEYDLYLKNLKNGKNEYLLPSEIKYGFKSKTKFKNEYQKKDDIVSIGTLGFCDFFGDDIYYVWQGNLRVIKINVENKNISFFGEKTQNYVTPKATKKLITAHKRRNQELSSEEKRKMSYVLGVFADADIIGVIFGNYDKDASVWKMVLQIYSPNGKLLEETVLPEAVNYDDACYRTYFYKKGEKILYCLSRKLDDQSNDVIEVLKYKIY